MNNPVVGCGTQSAYITETQHSAVYPLLRGQCPILLTENSSGPLNIDVAFDRTVYGASGIAFGILEGVDRGDLPSTYGYANHKINYSVENSCNYNPPFPTIKINDNLKLGLVPGDPDPAENSDDNAMGVDEDAFTTFPDYDGTGTYTLQVPLVNQTGTNTYLSGWFDFNQDGKFTSNEMAHTIVPNNTSDATLRWTNLPPKISVNDPADFAFRFRLTSNEKESLASTGFARDGEVEDYVATIAQLCFSYSIKATGDTSICYGGRCCPANDPGVRNQL